MTKVEQLFKVTSYKLEGERILVRVTDDVTAGSCHVELKEFNSWLETSDALDWPVVGPDSKSVHCKMELFEYWGNAAENDPYVIKDLEGYLNRSLEEAYSVLCEVRKERMFEALRDCGVVINLDIRAAVITAMHDYGYARGMWSRLQQCRIMQTHFN